VIWLVAHRVWTPVDYLVPSVTLRQPKLAGLPDWLVVVLIVWTLPFLWIGVSMTLRRSLDAGRSPWLAMFFFVPLVNYLVMIILCAMPSRPRRPAVEAPEVGPASLQAVGLALLASLPVGFALVVLCTLALEAYGAALFLGAPSWWAPSALSP
jgi:hypothetical protein